MTFNGFVGLSLLRYVTEYGQNDTISAVVSLSVNKGVVRCGRSTFTVRTYVFFRVCDSPKVVRRPVCMVFV